MAHDVVILGVFAGDATFKAARLPVLGETLLGDGFSLGPGGKGSNQAIAAAKAGADTAFITRLGDDAFAALAYETWKAAGVTPLARTIPDEATGAAFIFLEQGTGQNAIIVCPGAATGIAADDMDAQAEAISGAKVFVAQLEQPLEAAQRGLEIARAAGVTTILNPAPARALPDEVLQLCDLLTPNESETEILTGLPVRTIEEAETAARALQARGPKNIILTLGENGALWYDGDHMRMIEPMHAGDTVDTTGAGDAFNGGLATALAEGRPLDDSLQFATAVAAISVTRRSAGQAMPSRAEVEALLAKKGL